MDDRLQLVRTFCRPNARGIFVDIGVWRSQFKRVVVDLVQEVPLPWASRVRRERDCVVSFVVVLVEIIFPFARWDSFVVKDNCVVFHELSERVVGKLAVIAEREPCTQEARFVGMGGFHGGGKVRHRSARKAAVRRAVGHSAQMS